MTVVANPTEIRIPRTVVVSGADLRFACAHLLRRLAEGIPAGHRPPEILEATPGRSLPASTDFVVEADASRVETIGMPGVRSNETREQDGESILEWSWSLDRPVWKGSYLRHGLLIAANEGRAHVLGPVRNLRIPGMRHLEAVLPAVAAAISWGIDPKVLRELVYSWTGPSHSIQWAGQNRGIALFDDGSSCTSEGLSRALSAFDQKVTLVTGGPGFHAGFELLDRVRGGASRIVLLPQTPEWIVSAWSQLSDVRRSSTLQAAAMLALECTPAGGQVLFSPGCFPAALADGVTRRGVVFAEAFLDA